jgi:hypothetical protein
MEDEDDDNDNDDVPYYDANEIIDANNDNEYEELFVDTFQDEYNKEGSLYNNFGGSDDKLSNNIKNNV